MQSRDFCYWLQGFIEVTLAQGSTQDLTISPQQAKVIQSHLALVFKHEIDPSMGDKKHQEELNELHGGHPIALETLRVKTMADVLERATWALKTALIGYGDDKLPWTVAQKAARAVIEILREPSDAMLEIALDVSGERVAAYTAPRESGVAIECDLSEEDAASINESLRAAHRDVYCAMIDAVLKPSEGTD